jgi:hypothetical protein
MAKTKMNDRYSLLIEAVCYWLGFQVKIGREKLIHEASLRYPIADALTSENTAISQIKLEESHPLFKSKRIDLAILEKNKTIIFIKEVFEFKIAKYTTPESDEHQRVFDDVVRLAYYNMVDGKDCYFLMCGDYESFKTNFIGDKNEPQIVDDIVVYPDTDNQKRAWNSKGLYNDWFMFSKGKSIEQKFSINNLTNKSEWGLGSFKSRYELRDNVTSKGFYTPNSITIITECMAISPYGDDKTHAAGIWKIKAIKEILPPTAVCRNGG